MSVTIVSDFSFEEVLGFLRLSESRLVRLSNSISSNLASKLPSIAENSIVQVYAVSKAKVRKGLRVKRSSDSVELIGSGEGVSLVSFAAQYPGRSSEGASVQVMKEGGRKVLKGSFIPRGKDTVRQIFYRLRLTSGRRVGRLPIFKLWGPAVSQMLKKEGIPQALEDYVIVYVNDAAEKSVRR